MHVKWLVFLVAFYDMRVSPCPVPIVEFVSVLLQPRKKHTALKSRIINCINNEHCMTIYDIFLPLLFGTFRKLNGNARSKDTDSPMIMSVVICNMVLLSWMTISRNGFISCKSVLFLYEELCHLTVCSIIRGKDKIRYLVAVCLCEAQTCISII